MSGPDDKIGARAPDALASRWADVLGARMHYLEAGEGPPVLFLHGNPTSSFLWRNVVPHVAPLGRCLAVDLIGMGASDKPDVPYRFADHAAYLDGFIDALGLDDIALVMHDWGVSLGLHYLARRPGRVRAVAWMEGRLHPLASWADFDEGGRAVFEALRTPGVGERMAVEENFFIEEVLPTGTLRALTDGEMAAYRAPYLEPSSRRPLLRWAEEIPIGGDPADVAAAVDRYRTALVASDIPKLLLYGEPGALVGPEEVAWCRRELRALTVADVGPGGHFLPEDRPHEVGRALAAWLGGTGRAG